MKPVTPQLDYLMQAKVQLQAPDALGKVPSGERKIINISGGSFEGENIRGEILPGGADWQLIRSDGGATVDARYTLLTDDGAMIYVKNIGLRVGPANVLAELAQGKKVDPHSYYFRTSVQFETSAEQYYWLNNVLSISSGMRDANSVLIDFYTVS